MKSLILILSFIFSFSSFAQSFLKSEIMTGSYTVPKGKIAEIEVLSADFILNGSPIAYQRNVTWGATVTLNSTDTYSVDWGPGLYCWTSIALSGSVYATTKNSSLTAIGSITALSSFVNNGTHSAGCTSAEGIQLAVITSNLTYGYGNTTTTISFLPVPLKIKVKAGDIISGTKYLVQLSER